MNQSKIQANRQPGAIASMAGGMRAGCGLPFHRSKTFEALPLPPRRAGEAAAQGWVLLGLFALSWLSFVEKPMFSFVRS
jgi:hypothetical protein